MHHDVTSTAGYTRGLHHAFQYFWYRDWPMNEKATGAKRTDWTIHIGVVIRSIAHLIGLVTRFKRVRKKDVVLRSTDGDEIATEGQCSGDAICCNQFLGECAIVYLPTALWSSQRTRLYKVIFK